MPVVEYGGYKFCGSVNPAHPRVAFVYKKHVPAGIHRNCRGAAQLGRRCRRAVAAVACRARARHRAYVFVACRHHAYAVVARVGYVKVAAFVNRHPVRRFKRGRSGRGPVAAVARRARARIVAHRLGVIVYLPHHIVEHVGHVHVVARVRRHAQRRVEQRGRHSHTGRGGPLAGKRRVGVGAARIYVGRARRVYVAHVIIISVGHQNIAVGTQCNALWRQLGLLCVGLHPRETVGAVAAGGAYNTSRYLPHHTVAVVVYVQIAAAVHQNVRGLVQRRRGGRAPVARIRGAAGASHRAYHPRRYLTHLVVGGVGNIYVAAAVYRYAHDEPEAGTGRRTVCVALVAAASQGGDYFCGRCYLPNHKILLVGYVHIAAGVKAKTLRVAKPRAGGWPAVAGVKTAVGVAAHYRAYFTRAGCYLPNHRVVVVCKVNVARCIHSHARGPAHRTRHRCCAITAIPVNTGTRYSADEPSGCRYFPHPVVQVITNIYVTAGIQRYTRQPPAVEMQLCRRGGAAVAGVTRYAGACYGGDDARCGINLADPVVLAGGYVQVARCVARYGIRPEQPCRSGQTSVA